ncbi:MAG: hypothetical protein ACUVRD_02765 [Bacteroidia bacterium]
MFCLCVVSLCVWGQIPDSLLIERERIERLELPQKAPILWEVPSVGDLPVDLPRGELPAFPIDSPQKMPPPRVRWYKLPFLDVEGSYGRFGTPAARITYQYGRNPTWDFGGSYKHFSSFKGHLMRARWAQNTFALWGGYHTARIASQVRYEALGEKYFRYGSETPDWVSYGRHALSARLVVPFGFLPIALRVLAGKEIALQATPTFRYESAWGDGEFPLEVYYAATNNQSRSSLWFRPRIHYTWRDWSIGGGISVLYSSTTEVFPYLWITWNKVAFWRPALQLEAYPSKPDMYEITHLNPYVEPDYQFRMGWERRAQVGFTGRYQLWGYEVNGFLQTGLRVPVFYCDSAFRYRFLYEPRLRRRGLHATVSYGKPQSVQFFLSFSYTHFRLKEQPTYWHVPRVEANFSLAVNKEKFYFLPTAFFIGSRYFPVGGKQPSYVDISLKIGYKLLPKGSIFVQVHNILNKTYYRWAGYRERPIDARVGLQISL